MWAAASFEWGTQAVALACSEGTVEAGDFDAAAGVWLGEVPGGVGDGWRMASRGDRCCPAVAAGAW